jgi:hypothetical protein
LAETLGVTRAVTFAETLAATLGVTLADTFAFTAGRAAGRVAGNELEVWGVARMALFTADRWLIKDFFCTDICVLRWTFLKFLTARQLLDPVRCVFVISNDRAKPKASLVFQ